MGSSLRHDLPQGLLEEVWAEVHPLHAGSGHKDAARVLRLHDLQVGGLQPRQHTLEEPVEKNFSQLWSLTEGCGSLQRIDCGKVIATMKLP